MVNLVNDRSGGFTVNSASERLAISSINPKFLFKISYHVPKSCLTVPLKLLDKDLCSKSLAHLTTWSKVKLPSCLTNHILVQNHINHYLLFLTFFLSLGFSYKITLRSFENKACFYIEFLDQKGRSRGEDWDSGVSVLYSHFNHNLNTLPFVGFLGNIITDLLGILQQ